MNETTRILARTRELDPEIVALAERVLDAAYREGYSAALRDVLARLDRHDVRYKWGFVMRSGFEIAMGLVRDAIEERRGGA